MQAQLPVWVIFGATLALLLWAHRWFMSPYSVWLNIDEGYIGAFAMRMIDGRWLPFVDAVSHRGPMLYWVTAVAFKLLGQEWWVLRLLSLLIAGWVAVGGMWAAAKVGKPIVGAAGAIVWGIISLVMYDPMDGAAFNGEYVLNAFSIGALVAMVHAARPGVLHRHRWFFLTGFLVALGGLSKQVGAVMVVPFGLWTVAASLSRPRDAQEKRRFWTLAYAAGGLFPIAVIVVRYALAGELATFWYYVVTYNSKVYLAPQAGREFFYFLEWVRANLLWVTFGLTMMFAWLGKALAGAASRTTALASYDRHGFGATLATGAVLSALVSNSSLRNFGHYYMQFAPWVGMFIGFVLDRFARVPARPMAAIFYLFALAPGFGVLAWGWARQEARFDNERNAGAGWGRPEATPACAYIEKRSTPDQPIFIWGFRAIWYVSCHRMPASRYVFTTFPAGVVPWINATPAMEEERVVPGSRDLLLKELEETKPPIILDVGPSMMHRSMTAYPQLGAYLTSKYCPDGNVEDAHAYVRKNPDGSCPPQPAPPAPAPPPKAP